MERQQRELPWYKKWFDENYLLLYHHRNTKDAEEQVELINYTLCPGKNCSILDLGCGEGRYSVFFRDRGFKVLGVDISETLIRSGKKKYPHLDLVVGDMRAIPVFPGKFDIVLSLFTSFGYFEKDEENRKVLCSVHQSLKPGGIFWLDFLNPHHVEKNVVPENSSRISSCIYAIEKRKIEGNRIVKDIYFKDNRCETIKHYKESVRLFTRGELEDMMKKTGFGLSGCFGNYRGEEWDVDSERTIICGRKAN
jgi:SAM-dependent methyltransferase